MRKRIEKEERARLRKEVEDRMRAQVRAALLANDPPADATPRADALATVPAANPLVLSSAVPAASAASEHEMFDLRLHIKRLEGAQLVDATPLRQSELEAARFELRHLRTQRLLQ